MSALRKEKVYNTNLFYSPSWNPLTWLYKHVKDLVAGWLRVISYSKLSSGVEGWVKDWFRLGRAAREHGRCVCV